MIYNFIYPLAEFFQPFNLFRYLTFRTICAAVTATLIGFVIGPRLIRYLRRLKFGQHYDDDRTGDLAARFDKKNTPTMGGLLIFASVFLSSVLWAAPNVWMVVSLFVYAALTAVGFRDDYLKVLRRNRDGIAPWEKIAWQSGATLVALALLLWHPLSAAKIRELWIPFVKHAVIPVMPWWLLLGLLYGWVVGFSNAINLTDGLDGLAVGCTITVALVFAIMAYVAEIDVMMLRDSRYTLERYFATLDRTGESVGYVFPTLYNPRLDAFQNGEITSVEQLQWEQPRWFVLNVEYGRTEPSFSHIGQLVSGLQDGRLGYHPIYRERTPAPCM